MLISRTHVPAPHPSTPQTNKLVKAAASQALSWHTCWGWAMETWGDRWGASEKKNAQGKQRMVPQRHMHACVCAYVQRVCTCVYAGGWSWAWSDRGVLEGTELITATAGLLWGGRNIEKVTNYFCCQNMGQMGSGFTAQRKLISQVKKQDGVHAVERSPSSRRLLEAGDPVEALQG